MFIGRISLTPVDESGSRTIFVVNESFIYWSERHTIAIRVPAGFKTDLASVPRIFLAWLLVGGVANSAAVVHDFLYHNPPGARRKTLPREVCDDILDEVAEETKVPPWRRWLIYLGVRAGGWHSYGRPQFL